ncbi:unnamed protein product [Brachionus calyciflorus]|uniref:Uncharacterized protein n=1 Tax=Brachionus calyciflorus TaxID=104777 RepID=A0A814Q1H8_9BILA|nr:unnamed protein product [Brachionus calyciflorus]
MKTLNLLFKYRGLKNRKCPYQNCDSDGNNSENSKKHYSLNSCPKMRQDIERVKELEKENRLLMHKNNRQNGEIQDLKNNNKNESKEIKTKNLEEKSILEQEIIRLNENNNAFQKEKNCLKKQRDEEENKQKDEEENKSLVNLQKIRDLEYQINSLQVFEQASKDSSKKDETIEYLNGQIALLTESNNGLKRQKDEEENKSRDLEEQLKRSRSNLLEVQEQFHIKDENDLYQSFIFFDPKSIKSRCVFPKCDGSGHINPVYSKHYKAKNCPLNPVNQIIIQQRNKITQLNEQIRISNDNIKDYPDRLTLLLEENNNLKLKIEDLNKIPDSSEKEKGNSLNIIF